VKPEPIDLDRTEARRLADAAKLLLQRCGTRREVELRYGISEGSMSTLMRATQPWRVQPEMLARLEQALGVDPGAVLAGKAPKPRGGQRGKRTIYRVERHAGGQAR
jgi:hypothetical protein